MERYCRMANQSGRMIDFALGRFSTRPTVTRTAKTENAAPVRRARTARSITLNRSWLRPSISRNSCSTLGRVMSVANPSLPSLYRVSPVGPPARASDHAELLVDLDVQDDVHGAIVEPTTHLES